MAVYLRTADGDRVLLDTAKARLVFEERELDLTGATLDFYDAEWSVDPGEMGDGIPVKVLGVRDQFTGFGVEVPLEAVPAGEIAEGLSDGAPKRRRRIF